MKTLITFAALACSVAATPALAQSTTPSGTFNLTGPSGSPVTGTDGNSRTYSTTASNGTTVMLRVTGFSLDRTGGAGIVRDSFLGQFSSGLGVTSGDDQAGANNLHVVDNQTRKDFLLLQFDRTVALTNGTFNPFAVGGQTDTDATIKFGTTAVDYRVNILPVETSEAVLNALFQGTTTSLGTAAGGTRSLNLNGASGNLFLVGADFSNADMILDGFKFSAVQFNVPATASAVPEPATWGMMLIGFGAVGSAMRRRRAPAATLATA